MPSSDDGSKADDSAFWPFEDQIFDIYLRDEEKLRLLPRKEKNIENSLLQKGVQRPKSKQS